MPKSPYTRYGRMDKHVTSIEGERRGCTEADHQVQTEVTIDMTSDGFDYKSMLTAVKRLEESRNVQCAPSSVQVKMTNI
jgi:hypothetical protein